MHIIAHDSHQLNHDKQPQLVCAVDKQSGAGLQVLAAPLLFPVICKDPVDFLGPVLEQRVAQGIAKGELAQPLIQWLLWESTSSAVVTLGTKNRWHIHEVELQSAEPAR